MKTLVSLLLALGTTLAMAMPSSAADYLASAPMQTSVCNEHRVLSRIVSRFEHADATFLQTGLSIEDFSNIRQTRYEGLTDKNLVERHYCKAFANMTDSQARPVWYLVETRMGYAGIVGDSIDYCVAGLDPWNVYGAECRSLQ